MRLDKHPILMEAHNVVMAIEECGASEKLTSAVIKASALAESIDKLIDFYNSNADILMGMISVPFLDEDVEKIIPAELSDDFKKRLPEIIENARRKISPSPVPHTDEVIAEELYEKISGYFYPHPTLYAKENFIKIFLSALKHKYSEEDMRAVYEKFANLSGTNWDDFNEWLTQYNQEKGLK